MLSRLNPTEPARRDRLVDKLASNIHGATAIEFALVAPVFMALIFGIFQIALVFFAGSVLDSAVTDASRIILTGRATAQKMDAKAFKDEICSRVSALINCSGGVQVDVRTYANFAAVTPAPPPVKDGEIDASAFVYQESKAAEIVMVRAVYAYPVYFSFMMPGLANVGGNKHLMMSTTVFRNEPFDK